MDLQFFLLGFGGAAAVEIIRLYEKMGKLESEKFKAILVSKVYWFMTALMAAASGFIAWAIHSGDGIEAAWPVVLTGIGVRTLIAKPFELAAAHANTELGSNNKLRLKDFYG